MNFVETVYYSLVGELEDPIPGVENAYVEGSACEGWHSDMLDAYQRLCKRLKATDSDRDVEIIIDSLLSIQQELCKKMYQYGAAFGHRA